MKLGDVLPHWIFRERAGIDVEVGGTGGSAFAHLTEDGDNSLVRSDWGIYALAAVDGPQAGLEPTGTIWSLTDNAHPEYGGLRVGLVGDDLDNPHLNIHGDGSLHWGDGATTPDLLMARGGPGTFLFSGPGDELQAFFQGKDGTGVGNVLVDVGDAFSNVIVNAPTGDAAVWLNSSFIQDTAEHGIIEVSGNGFGATGTGLKVHSPNGTAYRLTVSNAGAVVVTAL